MKRTEVIARQAKKIAELQKARKKALKLTERARGNFVGIGMPLNDDVYEAGLDKMLQGLPPLQKAHKDRLQAEIARLNKERLEWARKTEEIINYARLILMDV